MSERHHAGEPARPPGDAAQLAYSYRAHRKVIGYLGIALPPVLVLVATLRSTREIQTSISAYYYTGAGAVFVGVLFAIGIFLFSYRGYKGHHADWWAGKAAFGFAIGVALFPTGPPAGLALARHVGQTRLLLRYGTLTDTINARVLRERMPDRADASR